MITVQQLAGDTNLIYFCNMEVLGTLNFTWYAPIDLPAKGYIEAATLQSNFTIQHPSGISGILSLN